MTFEVVFLAGSLPPVGEDALFMIGSYAMISCQGLVHMLCRGFVNRSAIGVGIWRFVEGGEHGRAIWDDGSTSLPSFRSRNGGQTLRAAIIHYMATSARLQ
jgi:hypothetical protein